MLTLVIIALAMTATTTRLAVYGFVSEKGSIKI
ncbi:MAG: hypothetical protein DK304_000534 [Chloroflexi bacterium]|jgi:hypothetical protein|nr:MAG: hypothetical protein DK304_000534 [Chloroflexota bacterium]